MTMGEYIKQLRTERELSQDALGKLVGVNRAAVNKWENGSVENIKRSTIKKLSEVFGVSPCDLMQWDNEPKEEKQIMQEELNPMDVIKKQYGQESVELIKLFIQLNETGRAKAIENLSDLVQLEKYTVDEKGERAKMA